MRQDAGFTADRWQVEHALAAAFGIAARNLPAFRSRLGELQRQGILGVAPGRGKKIVYTPAEAARLVFALSLVQAGLTPAIIQRVISDYWDTQLAPIFRDAVYWFGRTDAPTTQDEDIIIVFGIRLATESAAHAMPTIASCKLRELGRRAEVSLQDAEPRLLFNVTQRFRKFYEALKEVNSREEPKQRAKE
jgi:hypothetical protein